MNLIVCIVSSMLIIGQTTVDSNEHVLPSIPIVWPDGGTFKLTVGFAVPIQISVTRILVYGQNFQFQYALPQNATFFTEFFDDASKTTQRHREERSFVYRFLEEKFVRNDVKNKDCLKRSVCEAAMFPVYENGIVGELLHLLLTPDYGDNLSSEPEYFEAAQMGREYKNCTQWYPFCPQGRSILDQISRLVWV